MCAVQLLRVSVQGRISAAAEDFLLQTEKAEKPALRELLIERLAAAAEEIIGLFQETMAEYEDIVQRSEREICRQRTMLDAVLKPVVRLHRVVCPADVQQLLVRTEEALTKQQELSTTMQQGDPEPPHIKEEQQEEVWIKQEVEQPEGLEETSFSPVPVKSEDEEKLQSSNLHQTHTMDHRDNCGGPEPARNSGPDGLLGPVNEDSSFDSTETDESDCDWTPSCEDHVGIDVVKSTEAPEAEIGKSVKEKPFSCSDCGKRFSHKGNLSRHIRTHTGEGPFTCAVCNNNYHLKQHLNVHMRIHTGEKPHSCSVCGKCFTDTGNLKRHMKYHTGERQFTCSVCKKRYHLKEHLSRHMRYHTGEKPHSCSVCGKNFRDRRDMKRHMRIHTGEKPFNCSVCGKCFAVKGTLTDHMRIHTGEKLFSCSVCGKGFTVTRNLKRHMRYHTGEKPFSCSVCGKCFTATRNVKRHMKLHVADRQVTESADTDKPLKAS